MPPPVVTSLGVEPLDTTWGGGYRTPEPGQSLTLQAVGLGQTVPPPPRPPRTPSEAQARSAALGWGVAPQNFGLQSPARCTSLPSRGPLPLTL